MKKAVPQWDESFPMSLLGVTGDISTGAVDFDTVHFKTLRHWTLRLRNDSLMLEVASPVTGERKEWKQPGLLDIIEYDPSLLPEVKVICRQCEKQLSFTAEMALSKSPFKKYSDFCWGVEDQRRVVILTITTKCALMEDRTRREKRGAISKMKRFDVIRTELGLPKEVLQFIDIEPKQKLDPRNDFLCWQSQYIDDYACVFEYHRTPKKSLAELYGSMENKFGLNTLEFIEHLALNVVPTWEPALIDIVKSNIGLGRLREEVTADASDSSQP